MTVLRADWLTDAASQKVCGLLTDAGFQAWFVGGCVRNALLGAPVDDLDLATDAGPDTVLNLARNAGIKAIPTGVDHGTVTLVVDEVPYEVTTFRRDVATDGRRATVAFADDMLPDAQRRDFTMNALYAAPDGRIADPLGGLPDLRAGRVRFILDAETRIKEDYLRILRFFRFTAWYGAPDLGIDRDGLAACAGHVEGLTSLSVERVTAEMLKLLAAPDPAPAAAAMASTGALAQVLPGADVAALPVLVHLEQSLGVSPDPLRRLAVMGGDPVADLRLSKKQVRVMAAISYDLPVAELAYREGYDTARDALLVRQAQLAQTVTPDDLDALRRAAVQVFPLTAADLQPRYTGPALGAALRKAEARWISAGFSLTKDDLLD
ncbi:MAG: CCA tRNA nucleotidyltransferase [Pseudomonadota bacterium]